MSSIHQLLSGIPVFDRMAANTFFALFSFILVFFGLVLVKKILKNYFSPVLNHVGWVGVEASKVTGLIVARTKVWFMVAMACLPGVFFLEPSNKAQTIFIQVIFTFGILQVAIYCLGLIQYWVEKNVQASPSDDGGKVTTFKALGILAKVFLWVAVLLLWLDNLGFNVKTLLAGLGVGGVAVALAVQNILGDLFASLTIVLDKPFVIGDFVVVGEFSGNIEHIGLKTTRIRSLSGEQLIFSNGDLLQSRIRNFKRMSERRIIFGFGILYETPLEKVKQVPVWVKDILDNMDEARFDRAHFKNFGDSSLDFEVVYYVMLADYNKYMDIQQEINLKLFDLFHREGIGFAYPTRTLYVQKES